MASFNRTTPATLFPVNTDEVKRRLDGYEGGDIEHLIAEKLRSATEYLEDICWRSFLEQTHTLVLDHSFPAYIALPRPPFLSITSITYVDQNGDSTAMTSSEYAVKNWHELAIVKPPYNGTWPITRCDMDVITIVYKAGYGTTQESVPYPLRDAVAILAAAQIRQSWNACDGEMLLPRAVSDLISNYRVRSNAVLQCL